jgi:anthraniloyl-CoA monooxygenase
MGDAVHTAHFSIGSGTKLAMESATALVDTLGRMPGVPVPEVLRAYEAARRPEVERLQAAAQTSLEWFENSARYAGMDVVPFTFSLMTRSKRITWDELAKRDPALMTQVADEWAARHPDPDGATPHRVPLFTPLTLRGLTLPNRLVVSPMCQYSATDGLIDDWHLVHLGSRAVGGAGLVIAEATAVTPEGRITPGCAGLWTDAQEDAWRRVVDFVHARTPARIGLQLAHAGRRAGCHLPWDGGAYLPATVAWERIAPSAIAWTEGSPPPRAMTRADMEELTGAWVAATRRAERAGFDLIELHMAHGYLLDTFLSALTNTRTDGYGGPALEDRLRFPLEVLRAVRAAWPAE